MFLITGSRLDVTLQPDLPPYLRRALLSQLAAYAPNPKLQYPTEIPADSIEYTWQVDGQKITASSSSRGAFIQVSMEMDLVTWLLQLARLGKRWHSRPGAN